MFVATVAALMTLPSVSGIGGEGSDSITPSYTDEVDYSTELPKTSTLSDEERDRIDTYMADLDRGEAYRWFLGEDNRELGLKDVEESFPIVLGYSMIPGEPVTVWVTSPLKAGGIPTLLKSYDVEANVEIVDVDNLDLDAIAFDFVLQYATSDYPEIRVEGDGLVVSAISEEAVAAGPTIYGDALGGAPVTFDVIDN